MAKPRKPTVPAPSPDPSGPDSWEEFARNWKCELAPGFEPTAEVLALYHEATDQSIAPMRRFNARIAFWERGYFIPDPTPDEPPPPPPILDSKGRPYSQGLPPKQKIKPKLVTGRLADTEEEDVEWLMPGRIPLGTVTIILGRQGDGKSTFLGWLAATVSSGRPWPDSPDENPGGTVLILQAEESVSRSVRRRMNGFGFDHDKVIIIKGVNRGDDRASWFSLALDAEALSEECERRGDVRLIIVDPMASYLHGISGRNDIEARDYLQPIFELAEKHDLAVVIATHPNKNSENDILDRSSGTSAYTQMVRMAWYLSEDPNDSSRRLLSLMKGNMFGSAKTALALHYDDRKRVMTWFTDPVNLTARQVDHLLQKNAREAKLNVRRGPEPTEVKRAEEFLLGFLVNGPCLQSTAADQALNVGIKESSFRRALKSLLQTDGRVKRARGEADGRWWLHLDLRTAEGQETPPGDERQVV